MSEDADVCDEEVDNEPDDNESTVSSAHEKSQTSIIGSYIIR